MFGGQSAGRSTFLAASVAVFAREKMAVKRKVVRVKREENFVLPRANVF